MEWIIKNCWYTSARHLKSLNLIGYLLAHYEKQCYSSSFGVVSYRRLATFRAQYSLHHTIRHFYQPRRFTNEVRRLPLDYHLGNLVFSHNMTNSIQLV